MGAPGSTTTVSPRRIRLEGSSFCQLRCPSCPTTSGAIHPAVGSGFLKFEDFQRLLDLNPNLERIEISNYGEVFLNPHLLRILEYAHRKGVSITLENGVNLNHAKEEALEGLVSYRVKIVTCSIDGASPETYRIYRVRGDFDAVIGNIERINVHKRAQGSDLPNLVWQFVVFGHNEHEIPIAREMAERLGMKFRTKLTGTPSSHPFATRSSSAPRQAYRPRVRRLKNSTARNSRAESVMNCGMTHRSIGMERFWVAAGTFGEISAATPSARA